MIRGSFLWSHPDHPGLFALQCAKEEYRAIGSRFIGGLSPLQEDKADYDFLVTADDHKEVYVIGAELESHGFVPVTIGGYTEDELIRRFLRLTLEGFPPVDVLIMSSTEAERRLRVFDRLRVGRVSPCLARLHRTLSDSRGWSAFWWVTRPKS